MTRPLWRTKWFVPTLGMSLGVAAVVAEAAGFLRGQAPESTTESSPQPVLSASPASLELPEMETSDVDAHLAGDIREIIQVPNYTYLRIEADDKTEAWVAVRSAELSVGSRVRVKDGAWMKDFSSPTLKRTFESIYFGVLDSTADGAPIPQGIASSEPDQAPESPASAEPPNPMDRASDRAVTVGKVRPAEGPSGITVSDLRARRLELANKSVRVRAVVVKSLPGVLDRTFLHVRDGSGRADGVDDDLTVTMSATPEVGETVLVEGVVATDRDFGSGYAYDVILENARPVR